jgi:hypothetical protein
MGSLSNYAENKLLGHVLLGSAFSVPTNLYVGLSTADPTDDGSGNAEPSGNGYARVNFNTWATAASRATSNSGAITFPQASGNWGTITHVTLWDASTGGNMLAHDDLAVSRSVTSGYTFIIASGDFDVNFNTAGATTYLANKLLDHLLKVAAYTQPSTYVGLATSNPGDSGSLAGEPSGNGYAREQETNWGVSGATASNQTQLDFGPAAGGAWGTLTHWFIADASSAGNVLIYASLSTSGAVADGEDASAAVGDLDITIS